MAFKGLKINISLYVIIPVLLSMILIHFVLVYSFRKVVLNEKHDLAVSILAEVKRQIPAQIGSGDWTPPETLTTYLQVSGIRASVLVGKNDYVIYLQKPLGPLSEVLLKSGLRAIQTGENQKRIFHAGDVHAFGSRSYLTVCSPMVRDSGRIAALGLALDITETARALRSIQRISWVYILINALLFSFIAIYKIHRLIVSPLRGIADRADAYRDDSDFFAVDRGDDEFGRLSKALNRMLARIADDREQLSENVKTLEKLNADLRKAQSDMIRAEKLTSVGRLAAGIAHEIGNPIGIITGYLELLSRSDISDAEKRDYLNRAENELHRINLVIRQLLELSRPGGTDRQVVSVHEILTDFSEMLRLQPLASQVNITLNPGAENDRVRADANQLRQVFLNLVMNAIDAIDAESRPEKGEIRIESSNIHQNGTLFLEIRVIDDGPGIPDDILDNVFDPFFTTKEPGRGTGLGLSVCFTIIEGMGGSIQATSEGHGGTTLAVRLPVSVDAG